MNEPADVTVMVSAESDAAVAELIHAIAGGISTEWCLPAELDAALGRRAFAAILIVSGDVVSVTDQVLLIRSKVLSATTAILWLGPESADPGALRALYALGIEHLPTPCDAAVAAAKLLGIVAVFRRSQRDRREAEQLRMVVEGTKDYAIFMLDPEGRIASWNPGARLLKGYEAPEVLGRHLSLFYPPDVVASGWVEHELRVAADTGRFEDEGWRVRKDGSRFWANVVISALYDDRGELRGFAKVTRDLTSRREAEEAARRLAEETAARRTAEAHAAQIAEQQAQLQAALAALRHQTTNAEALVRVGQLFGKESDLQTLVQVVTDEATRLCGAEFGAFFYNLVDGSGESYTLYTLSGAPRAAFAGFPMPRNTAVFGPTFRGEAVVRIDDVTRDPRYGRNAPHHGLPAGHLPVRSYLAAAVVSRSGEVHGGLFFGHPEAGVFSEHHEALLMGIAGQAAVAIDNARLYQQAQNAADRLNLALGAADIGDWSWDAPSDIVNFSARAASVFGVEPGPRVTWTALLERLHPDDQARARTEVERIIAQKVPYDIEYRVRQADGTFTWVAAYGRALYDEHGGVTGMYGVVKDISERKQLQKSLSDSEARFRSLMEQAPFSIQVLSKDGRTLRVNKSWEELWGITLEQLGDYNILEDRQLAERGVIGQIRAAFAGSPSLVPAIRYDPAETLPNQPHGEDPVRWVSAVAYPIKDDAGAVQQVVLVHDDVTARRRAEAALHASEERLRLALDAGQMGVWDWNISTGALEWSDSLEPLHGLAPGEFGGTFEAFQQLIHPEDRTMVALAIEDALQRRGTFATEFRNLQKDGSVHWIAGSGKVFADDTGDPLRMIGIGLDVTQRKRNEQNTRFLSAASAALVEVTDFDSALGRVVGLAVPEFADWAAVDVLEGNGELRRVAFSHAHASRLVPAEKIQRRRAALPSSEHAGVWRVIRTGESELIPEITDTMLEQSLQGDESIAEIRRLGLRSYIGVPLKLRGKVRGALTFIVAESGHTYDADDLAVAQELARRTTVAIENAELYEEMRAADRRKDEFLATLAHELRNPLAPIRSGLDVLNTIGSGAPAAVQARTIMERQVEHLVRLVDDLLDVSRITRDRIDLRPEFVSLSDVIHGAVETSRPLLERSGNELAVELPAIPLHVRGDRIRLAQVLSNLLNNAAKYAPDGGGVTLTVTEEGANAVIRVRDRGLGIPVDRLSEIFGMFSQVHRDSPGAQGGLGIGLTLAKRLVELHGGSVRAHSEGLGKGSEFVVTLPLSRAEQPLTAAPTQTQPEAATRRRILVVDDNVDAARTLELMLGLSGHEVRICFDGNEAIAIAEAFRPDLVLLDLGLPTMSGYDVCRTLRGQAWTQSTRIVALTGWGQEGDRRRSSDAGFDDHLVKPVDIDRLQRIVASSTA